MKPFLLATLLATLLAVSVTVAKPASPAPAPAAGEPTLITAIRAGRTDRLAPLLRDRRAVQARDTRGNTSLHWAALAGDASLAARLLDAGAEVNATNLAGATALHYGTRSERLVRVLLQAGANPLARSAAGALPLHSAVARPASVATTRLLLDAGSPVDDTRPAFPVGGFTPLAIAAGAGDAGTVELLLQRGARPDGTNGFTPASAAAFTGRQGILERLQAAGASFNLNDGFAGHPLNNAFYAGHHHLVPFLLAVGSDLHLRSAFGEQVPPIVWSAYTETGDPAHARLLREKGVDLNETTSAGHTALDWARKRGETPLTQWLRAQGASDGGPSARRKAVPRREVPDNGPERVALTRQAIQRAVDLLQASSDGFLANGFVRQSDCVSCHQQTLPAVAFGRAREKGFRVDEASLARQLHAQHASWFPTRQFAWEMRDPQPDAPANLGYGLQGLQALGYAPDELTEALVWFLAESQWPDGSWASFDRRPPMEEGQVVGTALAVRALTLYPQPFARRDLRSQLDRARRWLELAQPVDLNQQVFRLLGMHWAGAPAGTLRAEIRKLRAGQRPDGGWAPLPGLESDAWATGQALFALRTAGGVPVSDPGWQRGMTFLLRTQFEDGSWWVASRTWPFQPHFDSGFPHGKDQWISAGGTAWAVMALLESLPAAAPSRRIETAQTLMARFPAPPKGTPAPAAAAPTTTTPGAGPEFARDILPFLKRSCLECHQGEKPKGGYRVDTREGVLAGGQSGEPAVVTGQAERSPLVRYVSDQVEDLEMPPVRRRSQFPALSPAEITRLRDWINHGAR